MKFINRVVAISNDDSAELVQETESALDHLGAQGFQTVGVVPASHTRPALVLLSKDADETTDVPADPPPIT